MTKRKAKKGGKARHERENESNESDAKRREELESQEVEQLQVNENDDENEAREEIDRRVRDERDERDERDAASRTLRLTLVVYSFQHARRACNEQSDKIILPEEALHGATAKYLQFPYVFQIASKNSFAKHCMSYCSVLEFTAENGHAYIPSHLMKTLKLQEGARVWIRSFVPPPKASQLLFHASSCSPRSPVLKIPLFTFLDQNGGPQSYFEGLLRHYSVLYEGQKFSVGFNNNTYTITVHKTFPERVVSILGDVDIDANIIDTKLHSDHLGKSSPKENRSFRKIRFRSAQHTEDSSVSQLDTAGDIDDQILHAVLRMSISETTGKFQCSPPTDLCLSDSTAEIEHGQKTSTATSFRSHNCNPALPTFLSPNNSKKCLHCDALIPLGNILLHSLRCKQTIQR